MQDLFSLVQVYFIFFFNEINLPKLRVELLILNTHTHTHIYIYIELFIMFANHNMVIWGIYDDPIFCN